MQFSCSTSAEPDSWLTILFWLYRSVRIASNVLCFACPAQLLIMMEWINHWKNCFISHQNKSIIVSWFTVLISRNDSITLDRFRDSIYKGSMQFSCSTSAEPDSWLSILFWFYRSVRIASTVLCFSYPAQLLIMMGFINGRIVSFLNKLNHGRPY